MGLAPRDLLRRPQGAGLRAGRRHGLEGPRGGLKGPLNLPTIGLRYVGESTDDEKGHPHGRAIHRRKKHAKVARLPIDGDNAQASLLNKMLAEIAKHGSVTIRRIYGDWTTQNMHSWKDALHMHAVQPIQQFRYTVGKNATDSAL
ncbi:MAG: NYN domain-containing protein, partial [Rhodopseudomonas palustris]|nr:NYN domain-containing protein [Rhodopseudomonas palustris]